VGEKKRVKKGCGVEVERFDMSKNDFENLLEKLRELFIPPKK